MTLSTKHNEMLYIEHMSPAQRSMDPRVAPEVSRMPTSHPWMTPRMVPNPPTSPSVERARQHKRATSRARQTNDEPTNQRTIKPTSQRTDEPTDLPTNDSQRRRSTTTQRRPTTNTREADDGRRTANRPGSLEPRTTSLLYRPTAVLSSHRPRATSH